MNAGSFASVASAASGVAKPDPRLFRLAAELLGAPTTAVLHVGDDLESDVHGARAAGCHAMLLVHAEDIAVPPDVPILRPPRDLPSAIQPLRWRASEP